MKPATDLAKLHRSIKRRLGHVRYTLVQTPRSETVRRNLAVSWAVIELDNLVIELSRQFLVSSLLRCRTLSGHRVNHNEVAFDQLGAALYIMSVLEPKKYKRYSTATQIFRRDETCIRDPAKILQVAAAAKFSNQGSILTALSLNTASFAELGKARHFYAHRNVQTAGIMLSLAANRAIANLSDAWVVPDTLLPNSPATMLDEWIIDLSDFAELLVA